MRRVQIRKVADLGTGHTPSRSVPEYWVPEECTIPWLTLADVKQVRDGSKTVVTETSEKISAAGVANSSAVVHPAGTVAFSRTASVGFSCILGTDMATSQDWVTWTCGPHLDPRYLLWVLRGERDQILGRTQGSTHKTIYMPDIEEVTVPLLAIEEQRRIAKFLDVETARIESLVQVKRSMCGLIEERTAVALNDVLGFGCEQRVELRRVVDPDRPIMYGIVLPGPDVPGGPPIVKGGNVRNGTVTGHLCGTTPEIEARYERSRLKPRDAVVVIRGAGAGRIGMVPQSLDGANITQDVARVAPSPELSAAYLSLALTSADCQEQLAGNVGGAAITGINISDLKRVRIPHLAIEQQSRAAVRGRAIVDQAQTLIDLLDKEVKLLEERRRSLVTAAVTGEMEVA